MEDVDDPKRSCRESVIPLTLLIRICDRSNHCDPPKRLEASQPRNNSIPRTGCPNSINTPWPCTYRGDEEDEGESVSRKRKHRESVVIVIGTNLLSIV